MPNRLTLEARAALQTELDQLRTTGRRQLAERIAALKADHVDLAESAAYAQIRSDQQQLEARIRELGFLLGIDDPSPFG